MSIEERNITRNDESVVELWLKLIGSLSSFSAVSFERLPNLSKEILVLEGRWSSKRVADLNKNAFQWDTYRPLVDLLPGGMSATPPPDQRQTPPPRWTDRHLWKHNLRKLRLRAVDLLTVRWSDLTMEVQLYLIYQKRTPSFDMWQLSITTKIRRDH